MLLTTESATPQKDWLGANSLSEKECLWQVANLIKTIVAH